MYHLPIRIIELIYSFDPTYHNVYNGVKKEFETVNDFWGLVFHNQSVSLEKLIKTMTLNPALLLGLPSGRITPGAPADLIVFDADIPFILDRETLKSKSKNTPFDGHKLQGKVRRTIVAGKTIFEC